VSRADAARGEGKVIMGVRSTKNTKNTKSAKSTKWGGVAAREGTRRGGRVMPWIVVLAVGGTLLAGAYARARAATDVRVGGAWLRLRASQIHPGHRGLTFRSVADPAIGPPFPDPTAGASLLVFASNASGQCRAEIALDPGKWRAIRDDGPNRGYRYFAEDPGTQGIRRIRLSPRRNGGRLYVRATGAAWPCGLEAASQQLPVAVALRVDGTRYCAAFDGPSVRRNLTGSFRARDAAAPADCPDDDLTVANLNILHGLFCPPNNCRLADRIALFYQWVAASGCPDLITLQEVIHSPTVSALTLLQAQNETVCPFPYELLYVGSNVADGEVVLSRYPILDSEERALRGNFRHVLYARVDHPLGPVDVFTTHLASSSDGAGNPCGPAPGCPAECLAAAAVTHRDCQAVQTALFVEERHDVAAPAVLTGDFNDTAGSFVYAQFAGRGWLDTYLATGNPECDPGTGIGCTSGRATSLAELESTDPNVDERIDFTWLISPGAGSTCAAALDPATDTDGDGTATRIFADEPNPFAACGPAPAPVCWPSDHEGTEMDLDCG
jgi:endonuclease/exonuclease/phosphatase family metal-dependent hydrolase